jgi:hypothetical protein
MKNRYRNQAREDHKEILDASAGALSLLALILMACCI